MLEARLIYSKCLEDGQNGLFCQNRLRAKVCWKVTAHLKIALIYACCSIQKCTYIVQVILYRHTFENKDFLEGRETNIGVVFPDPLIPFDGKKLRPKLPRPSMEL